MNLLRKAYYVFDAAKRLLIDMGLGASIWKQQSRLKDRAVPWLTLPAIHFLDSMDVAGMNVIEMGSGASTMYWAERAHAMDGKELGRYWGFERDYAFYKHMYAQDNPFYQMNVYLEPEKGAYLQNLERFIKERTERVDMVIVDGQMCDKQDELQLVIKIMSEDARFCPIIIVDDLNWLGPKWHNHLKKSHLIIPFAGFFPGTSFAKVTAICFPLTRGDIPSIAERIRFSSCDGALPAYLK